MDARNQRDRAGAPSAVVPILAAHVVVQAALVLALAPEYASFVTLFAVALAVYTVPLLLVTVLAPKRRVVASLAVAATFCALSTVAYLVYAAGQPLMHWF